MNEFSRKPAHAVPNWQAPTSTGKPAGHRGVARWGVGTLENSQPSQEQLDDDDELNINPSTPCLGKRPQRPKPKGPGRPWGQKPLAHGRTSQEQLASNGARHGPIPPPPPPLLSKTKAPSAVAFQIMAGRFISALAAGPSCWHGAEVAWLIHHHLLS